MKPRAVLIGNIGVVVLPGLIVLASFTASASTASAFSVPTTGIRLNLLSACLPLNQTAQITFPASTDFFVRHGHAQGDWSNPLVTTDQIRRGFLSSATKFVLFVDGNLVGSILDYEYDAATDRFIKGHLTNFAGGMTGVHLFMGQWYIDGSLVGGSFGVAMLELQCALRVDFVS